MNKFKIACLFNHHKYTIKEIYKGRQTGILICENCRRFGIFEGSSGYKQWYEYNDDGILIYYRSSLGHHIWYNKDETLRCRTHPKREAM